MTERDRVASCLPAPLSAVLAGIPDVVTVVGDPTAVVTVVELDSRRVVPGALFCCVRGGHVDGHDFAGAAVAAGASALLVERQLPIDVTQVIVADSRRSMAFAAAQFCGHPSEHLAVVGVTGTNGKTTSVHLLCQALDALGQPAGAIGTLSGVHTTPEAPELQRRLAGFVDEDVRAVAMEVSSHALALDRVLGTRFRVALFTNLGHDHLDLHETQERYFAAKARLFEPDLTDLGVVNVDDVHGRLLADAAAVDIVPYSLADVSDLSVSAAGHAYRWRGVEVRVPLGGRFNVSNSLGVATVLGALGHEPAAIAAALATVSQVPGRFERVDAGQPFAVIVDFAHTPDALQLVLAVARDLAGQARLIVVFGCGGDRDHDKRPVMGRVAADVADVIIVTSDNPRSEDPDAIIEDVIAGVPQHRLARTRAVTDRRDAIAAALEQATTGDVVVIAGKGHESTQTFRDRVVPFDDRSVALTLLENQS